MMQALEQSLPSIRRSIYGTLKVVLADNFSYSDPVDGSVSSNQGIRVKFENGSRIVIRLSGTGTRGATLRVYLERYERDPANHNMTNEQAFKELVAVAEEIAQIINFTQRHQPTLIT